MMHSWQFMELGLHLQRYNSLHSKRYPHQGKHMKFFFKCYTEISTHVMREHMHGACSAYGFRYIHGGSKQ